MLSISECRELLGETELTDSQVEQLRDALYATVENVLDDYYDRIKTNAKSTNLRSCVVGETEEGRKRS